MYKRSKKLKVPTTTMCHCGCKQTFSVMYLYKFAPNEVWQPPKYKRGHHPNSTSSLSKTPWNKGLTKNDHPSIERIGFRPGHKPLTTWDHVNQRLKNDPHLKQKWLEAKRGKPPWNKGLKKSDYPTGTKCGPAHGNWRGGNGGIRDTAKFKEFQKSIFKRDQYTCQLCGDKNHKGRGSQIKLEVHHVIAIKDDHSLALEPTNVVTLCHACHTKTPNYGSKAWYKKPQGGN